MWHNQGVGDASEQQQGRGRRGRKAPRPLGAESLGELAVHYVARFATSRARLRTYLARKLRERGWEGEREPDVDGLVQRLAGQGFVDDRAFADAKAGSLLRRGYGGRRVRVALSQAGIEQADREGAEQAVEAEAERAALRFAERRRIGPYASERMEREQRARALAAMVRAGHDFDLSRRIVEALPGELPDSD